MAAGARVAHLRMPPRIAAGDLTRDLDANQEELAALLELAAKVKRTPTRFASALKGRYLALLFEKPSLRTRFTFELAIKQLGGDSIASEGRIDGREPLADMARNLERWTQGIVARTYSQTTIDELAAWARIPVINALSDRYHPCQALADIFTLQERWGELRGRKLAFVGDGNNVAHSLMLCAARLGMHFAISTPQGYGVNEDILHEAQALAPGSGAMLTLTRDPYEAVKDAHAVYTDVWISMGQEEQKERRLRDFAGHQINEKLFSAARPEAVFMHCLPARRGEEVTEGVIEGPGSIVFDQAENRLHVQKALLLMLL